MTRLVPVTVKPRFIGFEGIKHLEIVEGASLQDIALEAVDILPPEFWNGHGVICVGDQRVPQEMWAYVRPRVIEGREIAVTLNIVPHGSNPRTAGILTTLAGVAITTAGIIMTLPPGAQPIGAYLITAGIGVTLSGIGMLLAPVPQQPKDPGKSRTIQAGVSENSAAPFEWLPRVLGRMIASPPQLIRPYTIYSRRSIRVCGAVGMVGRHAVSNVRINGALASSMTNLTLETRSGLASDTALTIGNKWVYEESPRLLLSNFDLKTDSSLRDELFDQLIPANSYPQYQTFLTRTGVAPDKVVLRVLFPQGMVADTSDNVTLVIPIRVEFRLRGSSTWILGPEFHFYDENKGNSEIRQNLTFIWQADPASSIASPNSSRVSTVAYYRANNPVVYPAFAYIANSYFSNGSSVYAYHVARDGSDGFIVYLNPATFPKTGHYEFRVKRGLAFRYGLFDFPAYDYDGSGLNANFFQHYTSSGNQLVRVEQYKFRGEMQIEAFQTWHDQYPLQDALNAQLPLTLIAFEGRDMEINSVSAQFDSQVPIFNGSNWNTIASTRNPAAHYRHVLMDDLNSDPRDIALVNSGVLEDWYDHCVAQDYQCNAIVSANEPEVLAMIASSGWAGQRSHEQFDMIIERDRSGLNITQNFTPINSSNYVASKAFSDLPHAFNVEYYDDADDNKVKTEVVYALGFSPLNATRHDTINLEGITVKAKVQDRSRNLLRTLYLRQVERRVDVGIEALLSRRGDLVGLSHDLAMKNVWFGVILSVITSGPNIVGLELNSRALLTGVVGPFSIVMRYTTQQVMIKQIINTTDTSTVTFATPFAPPAGNILQKGCLVSIGIRSQETIRCIVSNIIYKDEFNATVALIDEAPEIYSGIFAMVGSAEGNGTAFGAGSQTGATQMIGQASGLGNAVGAGSQVGGVQSGAGAAFGIGFAFAPGAGIGFVLRSPVANGVGFAEAVGQLVGTINPSSGFAKGTGTATAVGLRLVTVSSGFAKGTGAGVGIGFVPPPSTVPVYQDFRINSSNVAAGGSYTFTSIPWSHAAHAKRILIIGCFGGNGGTLNTPTVNGAAMTEVVQSSGFALSYAAIPTGASGVVAVSIASGTVPRAAIMAWIAYPDDPVPVDFAAGTITSSTSPAVATDVETVLNGFIIAFGGVPDLTKVLTGDWTGTGSAIEDHQEQQESNSTWGGWHMGNSVAQLTGDFSMDSNDSTTKKIVCVSWGAS